MGYFKGIDIDIYDRSYDYWDEYDGTYREEIYRQQAQPILGKPYIKDTRKLAPEIKQVPKVLMAAYSEYEDMCKQMGGTSYSLSDWVKHVF